MASGAGVTTLDWKPTVARRRVDAAAVARVSGKALLGVGLFILGFVAYELFVTSVFARRAQDGLTAELDQRIATVATGVEGYTPGALPESPIRLPAELSVVMAAPQEETGAVMDPAVEEVAGGELPGEVLSEETAIVTEPLPPAGNAIGRIVIPGDVTSASRKLIPACCLTDLSVRTSRKICVACCAIVVQVF